MKNKSFHKASNLLSEYINKNPGSKNSLIWYALGNALYMSQNLEKALSAYEKGFKIDPGSYNLCINIAKTSYDLKQFFKAGEFFEKSFNLTNSKNRELLFQAGTAYYQGKNLEKAGAALKKAVSDQKQSKTEWLRLYIHICLELKEWKEAEITLEKFLNKNPGDIQYWKILANTRLNRKNYKEAAAALEIAYSIKTPSSKEWEELANLYFHLNFPLKAARTLEKAYGKKPDAKQCEKLSSAFAEAQRKEKAIKYINLAIEQTPCADIYYKKGQLCYEWGVWKKAVKSFQNCIKLNPDKDMAYLLLGYCALEIEDYDLACKSFLSASKKAKYKKQALDGLELCKPTESDLSD